MRIPDYGRILGYCVGAAYIAICASEVLATGDFHTGVPLVCWGTGCYTNYATTTAIFAVLLVMLVRRDGIRGAPEALLAGVCADVYFSLGNPFFMHYYPWTYPVWAALFIPAFLLSRPIRIKWRSRLVLGFFVYLYAAPTVQRLILMVPLPAVLAASHFDELETEGLTLMLYCAMWYRALEPRAPVPAEPHRAELAVLGPQELEPRPYQPAELAGLTGQPASQERPERER